MKEKMDTNSIGNGGLSAEDAELLVKDLCARIPYGVFVRIDRKGGVSVDSRLRSVVTLRGPESLLVMTEDPMAPDYVSVADGELVKPYLRPESSITDEERREYTDYLRNSVEGKLVGFKGRTLWLMEWLNSHHIDYRDLIGKGLAIEAPEGMYDFKNQKI